MKKISYLLIMLLVGLSFISCEKDEEGDSHEGHNHGECCSTDGVCEENCTMSCCDNGMQMRIAMQEDGYTEVVINPIEKIDCYFEEWDKTIMTPVSGLFEYYDQNNTWVASIDFGDGACDQWATKTWDSNIFPDYPAGIEEFSLFE
ncbi:MAG: hypothetical protein CMP56_03945 [Flavobacteriales bacterium]|nr:hypothetical protein [Flavobacteriales bacterium]|tara:strand:- start:2947 stop:3384 length:438 start_codon:yes stop_codon:yes gene_type:complete